VWAWRWIANVLDSLAGGRRSYAGAHLGSASIGHRFLPWPSFDSRRPLTTLISLRGPVRSRHRPGQRVCRSSWRSVLLRPVHRPHGDPLPVAAADDLPLASERPELLRTRWQLPGLTCPSPMALDWPLVSHSTAYRASPGRCVLRVVPAQPAGSDALLAPTRRSGRPCRLA